ncbi:beta-phosphoglucomutase [Salipaludibacillus keqinensis]|uniref:Beta-phosphoglucomutase n=1 Tax=Salipaludibacillus keqinensis TaxID=2045207 RepID=A0A323TRL1_9BACI|nr:beta-phosphoglucomutase [Salipaludibacillus keqinensis]PYZ95183.1 beta-phosphoglucomutase [Salipaludibacillus keqinensis]
MTSINAVIFDLDGVLADTVEFHYLSTKKVAEHLNVPFSRKMNQQFQGMNRGHMIEQLLKQTEQPYSKKDIEHLGNLKNKHYQSYIQTLTKEDVLPGMISFLDELKENHISTAIASSSSNAQTVLENLQIIDYFDSIVPAKEVKNMKPAPEIFLKAAQELNIDPSECAAIEDSEAGIKAIKETSMFSIGVGRDSAVMKADWHVVNTQEITWPKLKREVENR